MAKHTWAKKTWIVVADAARARIYATDTLLTEWSSVRDMVHPGSRLGNKDLVSDPQASAAGRGPRSGPAPTVDHHDQEGRRFARELADSLRQSLDSGEYVDLVLVAPPQMMGWLRDSMGKNLAGHVKHEVTKDYTLQPPQEIQAKLQKELKQRSSMA